VSPERARLFVALDLPDAVRARLVVWARAGVGGHDGMRLLAPANLHVTLCFLGWREEAEAAGLGRLVVACAAEVRELALGAPLWLPRRRPRLLAVEVADGRGELGNLRAEVVRTLAARGGHRPEERPFRPHVTVARVRAGARVTRADRTLARPGGAAFAGAALGLYRSRLGPAGATYEAVARAGLGS
jgi:2'-5' RNA ligase